MSNVVIESCLNSGVHYFRWEEQIISDFSKKTDILMDTYIFNKDIDIFSYWLYTHFSFIFLLSGVILLVSMIGALLLTTNKNLIK
jgi:NADH:ubiquinone oxidoreductase subunit 6 (subunit J)